MDVQVLVDRDDQGGKKDDTLVGFDFCVWLGVPGHTKWLIPLKLVLIVFIDILD